MELSKYDFNKLNETDVREEIIAPLLRQLNYRSGTEFNIIREQQLIYPRIQLGRKKPTKDPLIKGIADYICEIVNGPRWTIEAKPPADITTDNIEQAFTYASHPEVRATYFCLANGKTFMFFKTTLGPDAEPILQITYDKLNEDFTKISNLVGPEALIRDHGKTKIDIGKPLGQGLRSICRILNGSFKYNEVTTDAPDNVNINAPASTEMIMSIKSGSVERNEDDKLVACLEVVAPFQSLQELNEKFGLDKISLTSTDTILSNDINVPTCFETIQKITLPAGSSIPDLTTWKQITLPANIVCKTETIAKGYLKGNCFSGELRVNLFYIDLDKKINLKGVFKGVFEIFID